MLSESFGFRRGILEGLNATECRVALGGHIATVLISGSKDFFDSRDVISGSFKFFNEARVVLIGHLVLGLEGGNAPGKRCDLFIRRLADFFLELIPLHGGILQSLIGLSEAGVRGDEFGLGSIQLRSAAGKFALHFLAQLFFRSEGFFEFLNLSLEALDLLAIRIR